MTPDGATSQPVTNRYDRMEIAGAFGDLGTLVPFIIAYLAVLKMDPFGVLFATSYPRHRSARHGDILKRIPSHAPAAFPDADPWRDSLPDRSPASAWILRHQ